MPDDTRSELAGAVKQTADIKGREQADVRGDCKMTEMIERVAKAIYAEFENRPDYAQAQMNGVMASELARAAIEAMREPTDAMALVDTDPEDSTRIWRKMIDEALR